MKPLALLLFLLAGCRTSLDPVRKSAGAAYVGDHQCKVESFNSALELPRGSKSLGWVQVPSAGGDEKTEESLVKKVCEMDGDAYTQAAWIHSEENPKNFELRANVWSLPEGVVAPPP